MTVVTSDLCQVAQGQGVTQTLLDVPCWGEMPQDKADPVANPGASANAGLGVLSCPVSAEGGTWNDPEPPTGPGLHKTSLPL